MPISYIDVFRATKYKLAGNGPRFIDAITESFADMDPSTAADVYGNGGIINDFEAEIAALLGKEKAVFFPSGTMAQQIAMRIWCDEAGIKKVAYHPLCHLEIHEQDGLKVLHQIESVLLGSKDRLFTIEDLKAVKKPIACLLIELPQREIGGQLPSWEELVEISAYCKAKGIKLHLDGARLFETLPYYNKSAAEICSLFDSAYVSFYKGLGGIAGAALTGSAEFTEQSKVWKRRHGGDLISLYPYIINAKYSMDKRINKMPQYWQHAVTVAELLNKIPGVRTIPEVPVCNMFHVHFDFSKETVEKVMIGVMEKTELGITGNLKEISPVHCSSELSFGDSFNQVPKELIAKALDELRTNLSKA